MGFFATSKEEQHTICKVFIIIIIIIIYVVVVVVVVFVHNSDHISGFKCIVKM